MTNFIAIELEKRFEGYSEKPYLCPAGILTAGYGHAFQRREKIRSLSRVEAEQVLIQDSAKAEYSTFKYCPVLLLENQNRQAAIIDFVFNLGGGRLQASTLRRKINQRNWTGAQKEIVRWVYAGGRKLKGLILRREVEAMLLGGMNGKGIWSSFYF